MTMIKMKGTAVLIFMSSFGYLSSAFSAESRRVLVTGAGGPTGQHVFRKLLKKPGYLPIGTVRTEASKKSLLEGGGIESSYDAPPIPSDSLVVCDITDDDTSTLDDIMKDCDAVIIATSAVPAPTGEVDEETKRPKFGFPNGQPEVVDYLGGKNLIDATKKANKDIHVVLCSSMGGTNPSNMLNNLGKVTKEDGSTTGGDILKWKRKAEVYLQQSGLPYTIVHPGGLLNEPGDERELCLGVDDKVAGSVPREDVANVMIAALEDEECRCRSFDLVSKPVGEGVVTKDYAKLVKSLDGANCDYSLGEIA